MGNILTPDQVCKYWDIIKYAAVNADYVNEKHLESYLNNLLYMLLSGKSQCLFKLDDNRNVKYVAITRIDEYQIYGYKALVIACIYAYSKSSIDEWAEGYRDLVNMARSVGCKYIVGYTANDRVKQLCNELGLTYAYSVYEMEV